MSISINAIRCPGCGANLEVEEGREKLFCSYCGTHIIVKNENEYIYRNIDEAKIKEAETDKIVKLKKLELIEKRRIAIENRKKIRLKISIGLGAIALLCFIIASLSESLEELYFVGIMSVGILAYMWIFIMVKNEDDGDEVYVLDDYIEIPPDVVGGYKGSNVTEITKKLRKSGFTNIQTVPMNDVVFGIFNSVNAVDSIMVDGKNISEINSRVRLSTDIPIVINYHSQKIFL